MSRLVLNILHANGVSRHQITVIMKGWAVRFPCKCGCGFVVHRSMAELEQAIAPELLLYLSSYEHDSYRRSVKGDRT